MKELEWALALVLEGARELVVVLEQARERVAEQIRSPIATVVERALRAPAVVWTEPLVGLGTVVRMLLPQSTKERASCRQPLFASCEPEERSSCTSQSQVKVVRPISGRRTARQCVPQFPFRPPSASAVAVSIFDSESLRRCTQSAFSEL